MAPVPLPQSQLPSEKISFPWEMAAASPAAQQAVGELGVRRAGSSVSGLFTGRRAQDMLSCVLPSSRLGLCHLSLLLWDLLPLPSQPAQVQGGWGALKAVGCREPEHRGQGWGWEHDREGEGCSSHFSKSMLGLSRSKMLPSFVLAQQWSWRALLRSRTLPRLPLGCFPDAAAAGKAKHP